jgi:purine nucleosidase
MAPQKILLDTDIGTDIDDAVCLAYLLSHPACDLLGITTVTGEAEQRAKLASAVCRASGKEVPIYPGAETPLLLPQKQNHAAQAAALGEWPHQKSFPRGEAVDFLRRTIRAHPGEITLLTIAPLTNIGLLFALDPEIPRLLRGLVMMCGRFFDPVPNGYGPLEWNALVDAHASSIVYRTPVAVHRSVGLDVTNAVAMNADEFRKTFSPFPSFSPIMNFAEVWFKDWPGTTFHDPLAAATILDWGVCEFERGRVHLEISDAQRLGMTTWMPDDITGPHEVARTVDRDRFFRHFVETIRGAASR